VIELTDSVLDILRQNRSNCENIFHKIFDQAKMNVKNMMLHYWFPEDAKVKLSEIIILLMTLSIFFGKPYLYLI